MLPVLTISVKKRRCCLLCCWTCLTKGDSCPGMQRTSPAAITQGARLWGPFLSRNPHCTPPRGVLLIPGYAGGRIVLLLSSASIKNKKKIKIHGARRGSKKMCVCVCVLYTNMHIYTNTHLCIYTHTHSMTPALGCWDHTWEREVYPLTL